jgi:hypothetical protein
MPWSNPPSPLELCQALKSKAEQRSAGAASGSSLTFVPLYMLARTAKWAGVNKRAMLPIALKRGKRSFGRIWMIQKSTIMLDNVSQTRCNGICGPAIEAR